MNFPNTNVETKTSFGSLLNERDELWLTSFEEWMLEFGSRSISSESYLAKAIEVKLSNERRPVAVFVNRGNDLPSEGLGVVDHKGVAVLRPAADLSRASADHSKGLGPGC